MILQVFSVFDVKAEAYLPPFFMKTKGEAIRAFSASCNDPESMFSKYPLDYTLMAIGTFDDSSGVISGLKVPSPLGTAFDFKRESLT